MEQHNLHLKAKLTIILLFAFGFFMAQNIAPFSTLPVATTTDTVNDRIVYLSWNGSKYVNKIVSPGVVLRKAGSAAVSGTTNKYAKFTSSSAIGNALLSDDGTNVILPSGKFITSGNIAKTKLDFGTTGSEKFLVTSDGGAFGESIFLLNNLGIASSFGSNSITVDATRVEIGAALRLNLTGAGSGKVLTSNASGDATWQTPSSSGITSINSLSGASQSIAAGTSGTNVNISSSGTTHTINIPTASASNRGVLSTSDWSTFNGKVGGSGTSGKIPKFTGSGTLGNSLLSDDGTNILLTSGSNITSADGATSLLSFGTNSEAALIFNNGIESGYMQVNNAGVEFVANDGANIASLSLQPTAASFSPASGGTLSIGSSGVSNFIAGSSLQIDIPSKGNAKVLTSDASGNATWQTPSGGGGGGTVTSIATGNGITGGTITTSGTLGLSGATGDIGSFSGTDTYSAISAVATGYLLGSQGVSTKPAWLQAAILNTSLTSPLIIGGTAVGSNAEIRSTSGVGTTDHIKFTVGNNGGTEAARILNGGQFLVGATSLVSSEIAQFNKNQNNTTSINIRNTNAGSNAYVSVLASNGTANAFLGINGTGVTGGGLYGTANMGYLMNSNSAGLSVGSDNASGGLKVYTGGSAAANERLNVNSSGRTYFGGSASATAIVHIKAGTATASTAPLKFTSGTNLTTAETGAMEYNGTNLFFTRSGTTRESVMTANSVNTVSPTSPNRTITVVIDGTTYYIHAKTTND